MSFLHVSPRWSAAARLQTMWRADSISYLVRMPSSCRR